MKTRYKNATIEPHDFPERSGVKLQWTHDNYDAWQDNDGIWRGNGGYNGADTIKECKEQIDEWIQSIESKPCTKCGGTGRRLPQTLSDPDGTECECQKKSGVSTKRGEQNNLLGYDQEENSRMEESFIEAYIKHKL